MLTLSYNSYQNKTVSKSITYRWSRTVILWQLTVKTLKMKIYNQTNFKNKELGNKLVYNMKEWDWYGSSSLIVVFGYYFHSSCGCMLKWSTSVARSKHTRGTHVVYQTKKECLKSITSKRIILQELWEVWQSKPFWFFDKVVATQMIFKANLRIQKGDFFRTRLDVFTLLVIYKFTTWHAKVANQINILEF